jgi:capsular polysaccharide transport system permease protein
MSETGAQARARWRARLAFLPPALRRAAALQTPAPEPAPIGTGAIGGRAVGAPRPASGGGGLALWSFLGCVAAPAAALALYFLVLAADQFVVVSRFTVRETFRPPTSIEADGSEALSAAGDVISPFTPLTASYIGSPAILEDLRDRIDPRALLQRPEADFWARLPDEASRERLLRQWRRHVRASVEQTSGIVTLRVRAFSAEDARALSEAILAQTEALVNALSRRQRLDALETARAEAEAAETRLGEAIAELSALRDGARILSPEQEAGEALRLLTDLTAQRIALDVEIRATEGALRGDAARLRQLVERRARIEDDIAALRESLAGEATVDENLAAALGRFEQAEVRRRFAASLYEIAHARLIDAEIELERRSAFLHVFEPPALPEDSLYPERIAFSVLALVALTTLWGIGALVWASVEDHRIA